MVENLWRPEEAAGRDDLDLLVYRSNLLGRDRAVCNWGGGNTSTKVEVIDFRGRRRPVMWVKGSGSDLAAVTRKGFTPVYLDDVLPLLERESMSDQEMVDYLAHCVAGTGYPRQSIETLLHAFLPFRHVDHTHPDAIISLATSQDGYQAARDIFGDELVWVPYLRPGFALAKRVAQAVRQNPRARLVILEKHGLITWGETHEECYNNTIAVIQRAEAYIAQRTQGVPAFGGQAVAPLAPEERRALLVQVLPVLRGLLSQAGRVVLKVDDSPAVLEFACSRDGARLSQVGAACPDHLVHTRRVPLWVEWEPRAGDREGLLAALRAGLERYAAEYRQYVRQGQVAAAAGAGGGEVAPVDPETVSPYPRVILIPGVGMVTAGKDAMAADISAQLYHRAIAVMRGAEALGGFVSLTPAEAFAVEYWPLELYKLTLAPPEREFSRQVAFVTGAASGIGKAVARRLARDGAHVVIADRNGEGARQVAEEIVQEFGFGRALAVQVDVTSEVEVAAAYAQAVLAYGGIDIVVSNAGISTSHPIEETTLEEWNLNMSVLATGYFLVSREAFRILRPQGLGGSIVFVASKNGLVGGKNASAYSAAKAAEVHLARCLAEEGGSAGIRVNTVAPDAVLQNSQIWNSAWREERARTYGIRPEELEEFYRSRTVLKRSVYPEDVAEAVAFLASDRSAKTTGCIITVDGGVTAAYTR